MISIFFFPPNISCIHYTVKPVQSGHPSAKLKWPDYAGGCITGYYIVLCLGLLHRGCNREVRGLIAQVATNSGLSCNYKLYRHIQIRGLVESLHPVVPVTSVPSRTYKTWPTNIDKAFHQMNYPVSDYSTVTVIASAICYFYRHGYCC